MARARRVRGADGGGGRAAGGRRGARAVARRTGGGGKAGGGRARGWRPRGPRRAGGPGEREVAESRSALAAALRVRRRERAVTQVRLAVLLGSSQSRVAKMEAADPTVSLELLVRGLVAVGASRREVGRIVAEGKRAAALARRRRRSHDERRR